MVVVAVFAPLIAPHSPTEQSLPDKLKPPAWQEGGSAEHLLGTDLLGRDLFSRLVYGARVSLTVAAFALLSGGLHRARGRHRRRLPRRARRLASSCAWSTPR